MNFNMNKNLIFFILALISSQIYGQKGIGISGKVLTDMGALPVQNKPVIVVFDSSALNSVSALHQLIFTQPDGSFNVFEPNIPDSIIPLEIMVYTFDCNYQRHGYLVTFNENDVAATNINIDICTGLGTIQPVPVHAISPDNDCPAFTRLIANDSLKKRHLYEIFRWTNNGQSIAEGIETPYLFTEQNNQVRLHLDYIDSITGFLYDTLSFPWHVEFPESMFHIIGGNVLSGSIPVVSGQAVLLYKAENQYFIHDTMQFSQYGYFYFNSVPTCPYSVRIPNAIDTSGVSVLPTYLGDVLHWTQSTFVQVSDDYFCANVSMIAEQNTSGSGSITGIIQAVHPDGYDVILYDNQMTPIKYVNAGNTGEFYFDQLPFGSYVLYSEKYGAYSFIGYADINASNLNQNVVLGSIASVSENIDDIPLLFPNPASNTLYFDRLLDVPVSVYTVDGQLAKVFAKQSIQYDVSDLPSGLYFFCWEVNGRTVSHKVSIIR